MTNSENLTSMRDLFKQNGLMISNALTNIIPTSGIMEMLNMIDYEEIDVNSPVFKNISIKIKGINVSMVKRIPENENQYLDLTYDIRVFKKENSRQAICKNVFYFTGKHNDNLINEKYKVQFTCCMELHTNVSIYDAFMLEACYQYAKAAMNIPVIKSIAGEDIVLPESYAYINEDYLGRYEGYVQHKMLNPDNFTPIKPEKVEFEKEVVIDLNTRNNMTVIRDEKNEEEKNETKH